MKNYISASSVKLLLRKVFTAGLLHKKSHRSSPLECQC